MTAKIVTFMQLAIIILLIDNSVRYGSTAQTSAVLLLSSAVYFFALIGADIGEGHND